MLWIIIIVLMVLWLAGLIGGVGGGMVHLLLAAAFVLFIIQLLTGRNTIR